MRNAVVVCPGRGTYNKTELGYLKRHFPDAALIGRFDDARERAEQETLSALDSAERYAAARHTRGDNASALIYAATLGDFLSIDGETIAIVAVTGNSMGWYSALACAGALSPEGGFALANTMGTLMQESLSGGQLIYPHMGPDWVPDPARKAELLTLAREIADRDGHDLALSIDLGGMLVLAGDAAGLSAFEAAVPQVEDRFPMRLANHAAFHTPMMAPVAEAGRARLEGLAFSQPARPLIDGRGHIWWPHATALPDLWDYTLRHQVTEPYDFTHAITVAAREFAPDLFIVTGPGTTLGGAIAQSLILAGWRGMASKDDFTDLQDRAPLLLAMGRDDQRALATGED